MMRATLLIAFAALTACGSTTTAQQTMPSTTPQPNQLACNSTGPASAAWTPASSAPATAGIMSIATSGDILTITFHAGTPAFEVDPQSNVHFTTDPKGDQVDVAGNAGAKIMLRGFRGDVTNYTFPKSITSSGPMLLEARSLGDFEGTVTFAAGLASGGCASVTSSDSTLTFHFMRIPG